MTQPTLKVLGVYRPHISPATWRVQWEVTGNDLATQEHFAGLVLIEAVVEGLSKCFDMGEFGQMNKDFPDDPSRMLVGYDEALLSSDGETLIARGIDCVKGDGPLRFAVYLHQYDPERPLQWQEGTVACLPIAESPVRLTMLVPYCACS
jgi:hypothetical protein